MLSITRRSALTLFAAAAASTPRAWAETWPSRPIRLIVPFPPGGTTDILARLIGQKLSEVLGQTVIVDNRAGAGGIMGSDNVAKSPPDGYMLLLASSGPIVIVPALQPKLGYDPLHDFTPISLIGTVPTMLVVNPNVPAKNVAELIALAKARPGMTFASTGIGATPHLAGELFKSMAGVDIRHIPYKGSAPALTDVMAGQVDMMFEQISAALPYARSGKLRAIAVGSATRVAAAPELPTISESGLPGFDVVSWFGVMGSAGMPAAIVARLNTELVKIMQQPEVSERLASLGAVATGTTAQVFAQTIAAELPRWADVIRKSGASGT